MALADAIFAIGIALYLAYNAYLIVRQSFVDLMDEELPAEERQNIISIVMGHEDVLGVHDLRTRRSGQQVFIQMHIDLHPDLDLQQAHDISEAVEGAILESYPNAEALIHQDPAPKELLVNP
ncbi:cation diffusion facilitator family transporter [Sneathiella glossodoripedis]|uniref:cation diffusion facilitator family transporter n=1 Tax=Sneathiella glossodoripedis TaxID=418853 RepID=UPI0019006FBE|nr:cation transporter dimerization domain-containing protein [Sneathiella glossodoripedis]